MKSFRINIFSQVLHRNFTVIKVSGNILIVLREGTNLNLNNSNKNDIEYGLMTGLMKILLDGLKSKFFCEFENINTLLYWTYTLAAISP